MPAGVSHETSGPNCHTGTSGDGWSMAVARKNLYVSGTSLVPTSSYRPRPVKVQLQVSKTQAAGNNTGHAGQVQSKIHMSGIAI